MKFSLALVAALAFTATSALKDRSLNYRIMFTDPTVISITRRVTPIMEQILLAATKKQIKEQEASMDEEAGDEAGGMGACTNVQKKVCYGEATDVVERISAAQLECTREIEIEIGIEFAGSGSSSSSSSSSESSSSSSSSSSSGSKSGSKSKGSKSKGSKSKSSSSSSSSEGGNESSAEQTQIIVFKTLVKKCVFLQLEWINEDLEIQYDKVAEDIGTTALAEAMDGVVDECKAKADVFGSASVAVLEGRTPGRRPLRLRRLDDKVVGDIQFNLFFKCVKMAFKQKCAEAACEKLEEMLSEESEGGEAEGGENPSNPSEPAEGADGSNPSNPADGGDATNGGSNPSDPADGGDATDAGSNPSAPTDGGSNPSATAV